MSDELTPYDILIKMLSGEIKTNVLEHELNVTSNKIELAYTAWGIPVSKKQYHEFGFVEFAMLVQKHCDEKWWIAAEDIQRGMSMSGVLGAE